MKEPCFICGLENSVAHHSSYASDMRLAVTWRNSKPSKKFASDLFQQAMPDVYQKFVIEMQGSRRFLLK